MGKTKVADFFLGLFCTYVVGGAFLGVASMYHPGDADWLAVFAFSVVACGIAITNSRPFIALGIVAAWALPFLAMGACLLIVGGFSR